MPTFFPNPRNMPNSPFWLAISAIFDFFIASIHLKRVPQSGLLSFGNSQKSVGVKSRENGGCGTICVEILAKWSLRSS